jgi:hypothetical protein
MSVLPRPIAAFVAPAAVARWEPWLPVVIVILFVLIAAGALRILDNQYRSGWVASQQVSMDKAGAIHKLLFREE